MKLETAIKQAKKSAKHYGEDMYVVFDCDDYRVANEYDMDTFFLGCNAEYIVEPDGSVHYGY